MRRLITKADRLASQEAQFGDFTANGYERETYKGLSIFTKDEPTGFYLRVFKDTSSNALTYSKFRTSEQRAEHIANYKSNYDSRIAWKAEQKAKGGAASSHASAAKAIKEELTAAFPGTKFSVTSDSFSMGDSVDIRYEDGPAYTIVDEITGKYQYGHFDGMQDMYVDSNGRDDIPQAKFVHVHREQSATTCDIIAAFMEEQRAAQPDYIDHNLGHIIFQKASIPAGATVTAVIRTDRNSGLRDDLWQLAYQGGTTPPAIEEATKPAAVETTPGQVQIIQYSNYSIAVIGDTKPIKEQLKELGGAFNARLTCGPGWIFRTRDLPRVQEALTRKDAAAVPQAIADDLREARQDVPFMKLLPRTTADEIRQEVQATLNFCANV